MNLIDFYAGNAADYQGRTLEAILSWDDRKLEAVHDYIQVLFPLRVPSGVNPHAPLLTEEIVVAFHGDRELRFNLLRSFDRMLQFYGLQRLADGTVAKLQNFPERAKVWLRPWNHNHLRITRILNCLSILGLRAQAEAFLTTLLALLHEYPRAISDETLAYWQNAVDAQ